MTKPWFEEATELLAKATPGPWKDLGPFGATRTARQVGTGGDGMYVARITVGGTTDEAKADAALIAAAPSLLKAALEEREGHQARWQSDAKWIAELSEERERLYTALAGDIEAGQHLKSKDS